MEVWDVTMTDSRSLRSLFLSADPGAFDRALGSAVALDADGDRILSEVWPSLTGWRRVPFVAALGDVLGPSGAVVLRASLSATGRGTTDLRCAPLIALAKREGPHASEEMLHALTESRNAGVRDYAVYALAAAGDDRAWEPVLEWLTTLLGQSSRPEATPPTVIVAVTYLVRHASEDRSRVDRVVPLLRRRWDRLYEDQEDWLTQHWPDTAPDGAPLDAVQPPNPEQLHHWILRTPLMQPVL